MIWQLLGASKDFLLLYHFINIHICKVLEV